MLLREEIEQSFGDGPAHRPIEELVTAGRRRVRRRQAAAVVAAFATAAVLATTYAVTAPGGGGTGSPQIADDPSPTVTADISPDDAVTSEMSMGSGDERVGVADDGTLVVGPAVEVLREIENPMRLDPPSYSVGLDLRISGEHQWVFMYTGPGSGGGSGQPVGDNPSQTFAEWVDDQVAATQDDASQEGGTEVSPDAQGSDSGSVSGGGSSGSSSSGSAER